MDLEGAAWCWGSTNFGRLGIGPSQELYEPVPARVLGGHAFTWLEAGMVEKCGVALGGAAYCWGKGGDGQIGDGTTETRYLMTAGER